ncbi:translocation/assembly module TamB domain-containing protein [Povalibacter sp.]|uniref:translocation/assembly module TamB domain-containing protein n=1 Tax=Povalibacter sp. TaxID=1962978 RepID=UPI002F4256F9
MRKLLLILLLTVLVAVPIALIATLLYTPLGMSMIAAQLHRLEPMGVRIEGLSGTVLGTLRIARFELDHPSVHVVSHDIVATIDGRELLLQTIRVSSLTARDTLVEVRSAPPTPPSAKPMRFLPNFMRIDIRNAELTGLRYVNIDGTAIDATTLRTSARMSPRRLRIRDFRIEAPQFQLAGNGRLLAARPLGLEIRVDGNARLERGTELAASAQANGTLEELTIRATLLKPDVINVDALLTRPEDSWRIHGSIASPLVSLQPWMENPPFSFRNIALTVDAQPDGILAQGNIGVPELSGRDLTIDLAGKFAQRVLELRKGEIAVNDTMIRLHVTGKADFTDGTPRLDTQANWTNLRWPLDAASVVSSSAGDLTLRGALPYDYTVKAQVSVPAELAATADPIAGDVQADGVLDRDSITMRAYTLFALDGSITGNSSLQFTAPRRWSLAANADNLNPAHVHAEFPGSVFFQLDATGEGFDKQAIFNARLAALSGTLRGERISGGGRLQRDRQGWAAQEVSLRMGEAHLSANGTVNKRVDAEVSLRARTLQTFLPDARGSVNLTASARGPVDAPRILANVQAENPGYAQWRAASLAADADIDLGGQNASRLSVIAQTLGRAQPVMESLRITGNGVAADHRIDVAMVGVGDAGTAAPRTTLRIDGNYTDATWSGTLQATEISEGRRSGEALTMKEPGNFVVSRDRLALEKLCLVIGNGQFCADGKWQRNGPWEGTVSGYEIPLAVVLPPSGPEAEYSGRIEGRVHVSGAPNRPWLVDAGARIMDAAVIYRPPGAEPETLNLGNGGLSCTATAERIDFSLGVQAFEDTFLYANANIDRNGSNDLMHLPLTGDVRARAADANILPILFTEIDNAAGLLTANVDVRGTLAQPEINGHIELANGAFDSYRVNLALRQLNLAADLANNSLDFRGSGAAGDGTLKVGGKFTWTGGELRGNLSLNGENLLVADLPEYRVVASPDLKFAIDGKDIGVAGDVLIPEASIKPVNLGGAVQASDDAHYVGDTEAEQKGQYVVNSEVRVKMGDDVRVDAFGLQGRIVGGVGTTVHTGNTPVGRGELSVADGRYEAYGQKLDISRGRLLFDGSPLEDPGLDIEAQRKIENIKVGLNVRGTLKDPRLTFFSEPSMSQTSIMSYLLVGKGIDDMQNGDAVSMSSAKDTLALQGGGLLASQLGRRMGLEEVGVESTTSSAGQTNTSLVLGKFLSPRLFISYGISLTESINTFKLRYTISDKWILKMEAGEVQSADAEYTIER